MLKVVNDTRTELRLLSAHIAQTDSRKRFPRLQGVQKTTTAKRRVKRNKHEFRVSPQGWKGGVDVSAANQERWKEKSKEKSKKKGERKEPLEE